MIKISQAIIKYIYTLEKAGVSIDEIYYHDVSGSNIFIINEEIINDIIQNTIDTIIEDSLDNYYDVKNDTPLLNIITMTKEEIFYTHFDKAKDRIAEKYKILFSKNTIEASIFTKKEKLEIVENFYTTLENIPEKKFSHGVQIVQEVSSLEEDMHSYNAEPTPIVYTKNTGKNYAYAA